MKASDNEYPSVLFDEQGSDPATPASGTWRLFAKSTGLYLIDDTGSVIGPLVADVGGSLTYVRKTSDETFSSTSAADSTGMGFAVVSGNVYHFRYVVFFDTNATSVGIRLGINGPTTTALRYGGYVPVSAPNGAGSAIMHVSGDTYGVGTFAATTGPGTALTMAIIEGIIIPSANGTLILRHASETATDTTVYANSFGVLTQIA